MNTNKERRGILLIRRGLLSREESRQEKERMLDYVFERYGLLSEKEKKRPVIEKGKKGKPYLPDYPMLDLIIRTADTEVPFCLWKEAAGSTWRDRERFPKL